MSKRTMTIEAALRWAYRDDLPKQPARVRPPEEAGKPWNKVSSVGTLGTVIDSMSDAENEFGLCPFAQADSGPHPDAIELHAAVCRLDDLDLALPDGWNPLSDCGMGDEALAAANRAAAMLAYADGSGRTRLKIPPRLLIQRCAILGPPLWETEQPVRREFTGPDGRPRWFRRVTIPVGEGGHPYETEIDGFDAKKRRPHPDAYRRFVWEPDPAGIAVDRGKWELWRACLDALVDDPALQLETITLRPSDFPSRPWESARQGPRVHVRGVAQPSGEKNAAHASNRS
jgi:hypothetical protein